MARKGGLAILTMLGDFDQESWAKRDVAERGFFNEKKFLGIGTPIGKREETADQIPERDSRKDKNLDMGG